MTGGPELTPVEQARWDAIQAAVRAVSQGLHRGDLDGDGLAASMAKIGDIALDMNRVRDSLHIPEDAAEHTPQLTAMLLRIPDGWGRWISCDRGWYPLITGLDAALAAIDSGYVIHQVKEKFGVLRYYAHPLTQDRAAQARFHALIAAAETASATTCERCGGPGRLCATPRLRWLKTLCDGCISAMAAAGGPVYRPATDD